MVPEFADLGRGVGAYREEPGAAHLAVSEVRFDLEYEKRFRCALRVDIVWLWEGLAATSPRVEVVRR